MRNRDHIERTRVGVGVRDVVITGVGVVLPGCSTKEQMWGHLRDGESQLHFEAGASPEDRIPMGRVTDFDPEEALTGLPHRFTRHYEREVQLYLASLLRARDDAGLDLSSLVRERVGLFDGCSRPMFLAWYERIRREAKSSAADVYSRMDLITSTPGQAVGTAAALLEIRGPTYTFGGACSAGAIAIGHAYREIAYGEIDVALATGHEASLSPPLMAMYRDSSLLSLEREDATHAVQPFGGRQGNAFGEGAVTLVMESRGHAHERGAEIIAEVCGYRYANNGFHPATPDLSGGQTARLLRELMHGVDADANDIGFVVGHGNSVYLSDASEENYMLLAFGDRAREIPLVSNKPIYGHTLGASSTLNVASAAMMLQHHFVTPTLNADDEGFGSGLDHMPNVGRTTESPYGFAVSFGLGGNNAALMLKREEMT